MAGTGEARHELLPPEVPRVALDSGATHHMVADRRFLRNTRDLPSPRFIVVADGFRLVATTAGDIETEDIKLTDVYLVPGLKMNVASVRQLANMGVFTTFGKNHAELRKEGELVGGAIAYGGLYQLRFLKATGASIPPAGSMGSDSEIVATAASNHMTGHRSLIHNYEMREVKDYEYPAVRVDFEDSPLICGNWYAFTDEFALSDETGGGSVHGKAHLLPAGI